MRNTSIVGGDFINNCIVIKLDDYDTEISVINRKMGKINIIDNFEIEIGIKHLISLEAKKEFIKIITSKLNDYKHLKEIFFSVQNEDVIIREYPEIQRVKKRDLDGYVNFEIVKDMPVNIEHYVIKYKVLNLQKNIMDIQLILFPKYIEKICTEIAQNLNIKRKYLNMNFDIIQKLIDKKKIDLGHENCIIIENKRNYIILNSVKQRKIYTSTVFEKYGNEDYILSFLEKDIHIFYYGKEDSFIKNIKENEFCVDKLNLNLKVNSLNKEDTVDNIINQNLINIGVVV
jgi:type IV pilus assembly protein PilM